ncbi:MAG: hypothetical protein DRI24_18145 [Deltaproteobacteria bacterium]|nr:MAG: hypothetical protein DRI24_18145 [Deltaproteobacteria bacterium]
MVPLCFVLGVLCLVHILVKKTKAITKTRNLKNTKFSLVFFVLSSFRVFVIEIPSFSLASLI